MPYYKWRIVDENRNLAPWSGEFKKAREAIDHYERYEHSWYRFPLVLVKYETKNRTKIIRRK